MLPVLVYLSSTGFLGEKGQLPQGKTSGPKTHVTDPEKASVEEQDLSAFRTSRINRHQHPAFFSLRVNCERIPGGRRRFKLLEARRTTMIEQGLNLCGLGAARSMTFYAYRTDLWCGQMQAIGLEPPQSCVADRALA